MSKTDATRPTRVRLLDRNEWFEAAHDHSQGPCDLPANPADALGRPWPRSTRCTWSSTLTAVHTPAATGTGCHCSVCRDRVGRKREARAARRTGSRYARGGWRAEY